MNQEMGYIIAGLLAANTGILGIASGLLFQWMKRQEDAVLRAHERLDTHTENHAIHTVSFQKA